MSSNDCSLTQPLLGAYLDGELPNETAERLAEHLGECAPCRDILSRLAETDRLLRANRPEFPTELAWSAMEARVLARAGNRSVRRAVRVAAVAAAAALILGVAMWLVGVLGPERGRVFRVDGETAQSEELEESDEAPLDISIERG